MFDLIFNISVAILVLCASFELRILITNSNTQNTKVMKWFENYPSAKTENVIAVLLCILWYYVSALVVGAALGLFVGWFGVTLMEYPQTLVLVFTGLWGIWVWYNNKGDYFAKVN